MIMKRLFPRGTVKEKYELPSWLGSSFSYFVNSNKKSEVERLCHNCIFCTQDMIGYYCWEKDKYISSSDAEDCELYEARDD